VNTLTRTTLLKKRLQSVLLVLFVVALTSAQTASLFAADHKAVSKEIGRIPKSIREVRTFTAADRRFILKTAKKSDLASEVRALLVLSIAVDAGLYQRGDLLRLTEGKIVSAEGLRSYTFLLQYRSDLKLPIADGPDICKTAKEKRFEDDIPQLISEEERQLAIRALSDKSNSNKREAARIFVKKRGMDSKSLKWALAQIDPQIRRSRSDESPYWECLRRVVLKRNPAKAAGGSK